MTLGSSDLLAAARPPTDCTTRADGENHEASTPLAFVWFWSVALLLAVITWWPLVIRPASGLQGGDTYTYFFPLKAWYADRLHAGELALWNPLIGHGFPALGESQTGVFYPFHLLLYRLLPLNTAYHANFLVHYVLAFGFTCHYVRRIGYAPLESMLAAVVFVYGWFPARSCLEWSIVTGAWIPLAFWGVERFVRESRPRALVATQLALVMQLVAGHFNLAFITLVGLALYVPLRLLSERRSPAKFFEQQLCVVLIAMLACGIAAVQLLPSWELKNRSQRSTTAFAEQQVGYGAIPLSYLAQVIQPSRIYPFVNDPAFERTELGAKNTNKVEAHLYFGLVPLGLACLGVVVVLARLLRRNRRPDCRPLWIWCLIGAVSLTFALGIWTPIAVHLPGFGYFTGPGRYGVLVQFAVAVLASAGARLIREWTAAVTSRRRLLGGAATLAGCLGMTWATARWIGWSGGAMSVVGSLVPAGWLTQAEWELLFFVGMMIVVATAALMNRPVWSFLFTATVLAWLDVMSVARFVQFAEIRPDSPIHYRDLSIVRLLLEHREAATRLLARNQNAVSLCGAATVPVYLGIGPREYFGGALQVPAEFHWEQALTPTMLQWARWCAISHVLSFEAMNDDNLDLVWMGYDPLLHGVLGRSPEQPLWLYAVRHARWRCYWVPSAAGRSALDPGADDAIHTTPVTDIHTTANQVTLSVQCDEQAVVVLTELMYPGWKVWVDGRRREPVGDSVFRAVLVDAGKHQIQWRYRPASLTIGIAVSVCAVAGSSLFYVTHRNSTRKS